MTTHIFIPVFGKRLRVTTLDVCGNPPVAATPDSLVVTDGFISVSLSSEVEDGVEVITRKADGSLCVNEKQNNSFKRFTVEAEFCGVNPSLLAMVSNAEAYGGYGTPPVDVVGITVPEGEIEKKFSLELWTGLTGQDCGEAEEASGYLLLPFVQSGVLGDITVDGENAISFSLTGAFTKGGNAWDVGPYDVMYNAAQPAVAAPLPTALDPLDHLLLIDVGLAPPPHSGQPAAMPA